MRLSHTQGENHATKAQGEDGCRQAQERGLRGNKPADPWFLDFQPLELQEKNFCPINHPLWRQIQAAPADDSPPPTRCLSRKPQSTFVQGNQSYPHTNVFTDGLLLNHSPWVHTSSCPCLFTPVSPACPRCWMLQIPGSTTSTRNWRYGQKCRIPWN